MADDFKVGDVVVCVDDEQRQWPFPVPIKRGSTYRVREVSSRYPGLRLTIDQAKGEEWWWSDRFRKLPPASDEFTARIRACKPHNTKVPA